jgi:hypothetical protein
MCLVLQKSGHRFQIKLKPGLSSKPALNLLKIWFEKQTCQKWVQNLLLLDLVWLKSLNKSYKPGLPTKPAKPVYQLLRSFINLFQHARELWNSTRGLRSSSKNQVLIHFLQIFLKNLVFGRFRASQTWCARVCVCASCVCVRASVVCVFFFSPFFATVFRYVVDFQFLFTSRSRWWTSQPNVTLID